MNANADTIIVLSVCGGTLAIVLLLLVACAIAGCMRSSQISQDRGEE